MGETTMDESALFGRLDRIIELLERPPLSLGRTLLYAAAIAGILAVAVSIVDMIIRSLD